MNNGAARAVEHSLSARGCFCWVGKLHPLSSRGRSAPPDTEPFYLPDNLRHSPDGRLIVAGQGGGRARLRLSPRRGPAQIL